MYIYIYIIYIYIGSLYNFYQICAHILDDINITDDSVRITWSSLVADSEANTCRKATKNVVAKSS